MVGIVSYGVHIPWLRIQRKTISKAMGWLNSGSLPGTKAVANYDEDSITMAVSSSAACCDSRERQDIDSVFFATTTAPYKERHNAGIIAAALDLAPEVRTADIGGSTRAGTTALLAACDAVEAGSARHALVCASDCHLAKPGSPQEQVYGHSGAALLVGNSDLIASVEGSHTITYDFMDNWKTGTEEFGHSWEDRWIREEGYSKLIPEAIFGLLSKYKMDIGDFRRVIYPFTSLKDHVNIAKKLGIDPTTSQSTVLVTLGDTGTAYPLMMLIAVLEEAQPGDRILVAGYGGGVDVVSLQVTEKVANMPNMRWAHAVSSSTREMTGYEKYAFFNDALLVEKGIRGEIAETVFTPVSRLWRDRRAIMGLVGSKCRQCGTPQYPPQRICVKPCCGAVDDMVPYSFSNKVGRLVAYTGDNLAYCPSPPNMYGLVDFDGGGRYWFDLTDCDLDSLSVGMRVRMCFRRKYADKRAGISGYFWKATPVHSQEAER